MSLAFEFAGAVFLFWFLGRLVDGWLGTEPWAQLAGSLVGWLGGFLHVYYATQRGHT
jgi:F0F1-type ATP synthase assembly protein I